MQIITNKLLSFLLDEFKMDWNGIHGLNHWLKVHDNGLWIASLDNRVNTTIVALFGILHDIGRTTDDKELEHGSKASRMVEKLNGDFFTISEEESRILSYACLMHPYPMVSFDPTVGACWDADRLELPRAGIEINTRYISTLVVKDFITCPVR